MFNSAHIVFPNCKSLWIKANVFTQENTNKQAFTNELLVNNVYVSCWGHDSPPQMKNELFAFIFLLNRAYHHHFKHSLSTLFSGLRSFQPVGFLLVAVLDLFAGFSWQREITQHNLLSICTNLFVISVSIGGNILLIYKFSFATATEE